MRRPISGDSDKLVAALEDTIKQNVVWSSLVMQQHGIVSDDGAQKVSFGAIVFVATDGDETPAVCQLGNLAIGGMMEGMSAVLSLLPKSLQDYGVGVMEAPDEN